jgi:L-ascorbate metabolism protein UlaG (beta-lactamase superfamily)
MNPDLGISITWLGHATVLYRSVQGRSVLVDAWVDSNPACPEVAKDLKKVDLMLITHGHFDHFADCVSIAKRYAPDVVCNFEISQYLGMKGVEKLHGINKGGSVSFHGIRVTMVNAVHGSSVVEDGRVIYLGHPAGYVIRFEDTLTIYFAGDTDLFGDMRLIGELYRPTIAFLPIGDRFTMGPATAARAAELLGVRQVVPMHYGTFPFLTGTPAALRALVEPRGVQVLELKPGETTA